MSTCVATHFKIYKINDFFLFYTLIIGLLLVLGNKEKVATIENTLSAVQKTVSIDGVGATYVRWGRTTCPGNGSELVYEGYTAGSEHS